MSLGVGLFQELFHKLSLFLIISGTGTRIDLIPAFCTINLPLFLRVDRLEYLLQRTIASDSISKLLEKILFYIRLILRPAY